MYDFMIKEFSGLLSDCQRMLYILNELSESDTFTIWASVYELCSNRGRLLALLP